MKGENSDVNICTDAYSYDTDNLNSSSISRFETDSRSSAGVHSDAVGVGSGLVKAIREEIALAFY